MRNGEKRVGSFGLNKKRARAAAGWMKRRVRIRRGNDSQITTKTLHEFMADVPNPPVH